MTEPIPVDLAAIEASVTKVLRAFLAERGVEHPQQYSAAYDRASLASPVNYTLMITVFTNSTHGRSHRNLFVRDCEGFVPAVGDRVCLWVAEDWLAAPAAVVESRAVRLDGPPVIILRRMWVDPPRDARSADGQEYDVWFSERGNLHELLAQDGWRVWAGGPLGSQP